jgi:hypothetical protein
MPTSTGSDTLAAHPIEATVNTAVAVTNNRRTLNRSAIDPAAGISTATMTRSEIATLTFTASDVERGGDFRNGGRHDLGIEDLYEERACHEQRHSAWQRVRSLVGRRQVELNSSATGV